MHQCVTYLHSHVQETCPDSVQLFCESASMETNERLKELRKRTPRTVRQVATALGWETHSKYAYYESKRFKGPLPLDLARKLANLFYRSGKVDREEVLELAGLTRAESEREALRLKAELNPRKTQYLAVRVEMPNEDALTSMFFGMFAAIGRKDLGFELASRLAQLLPAALQATPIGQQAADAAEDNRQFLFEHLRQAAIDDLDMPL